MRDKEHAEENGGVLRLLKTQKGHIIQIFCGRTLVIILLLLIQLLFFFAVVRFLSQYIPYFLGSYILFTAAMLIYVMNTHQDPTIKLSWCFIIAVIPVFGILLYLFTDLDLGHRTEQKLLQQIEKESAVYVMEPKKLMAQIQEEDKGFCRIADYALKNGFPIYQNTHVTHFPLGEQMLEELLLQLEQASSFIFLEYFIVEEGYMWGKVLNTLAKKAKEGVEVRVMYDGTCSFMTLPYNYPEKMQKLGIQCKAFAPIHAFVSTHYNNRDHRKILVIDGHTGFTGGVNLADEYINRRQKHGHWKDTAVMLKGEAVRTLTLLFLQMWNISEREHIYEPYFIPVDRGLRQEEGYVLPYGDSPLDDERIGEMIYLDILNTAQDYVYIMTPYMILDHQMMTAMTFAAKRGVNVKLILPSKSDSLFTVALAKSHYLELTRAGVEIYEYLPGFVHAKQFVSDNQKAVVGTINLDYRSLYLHFECAVYLYQTPAVQDILEDFQVTLAKCKKVTLEEIQNERLFVKLAGSLLKLAAPLM